MGKLTGRITEFLGQWTNDRDTEAKGRAEKKHPEAEVDQPEVEQEKERVRRDHGDVSR
jgi:uncharacterized protein YjbJ (UPF0337 family)